MKRQRIRKTIVSFVLLLALVTVQVMQVAAETDHTKTPSVVCSNFSSLYSALIQANDGDVIGIDDTIIVGGKGDDFSLGYSDKHVTIVRMNALAVISLSHTGTFTIKNLTFDGNDIDSGNAMVLVNNSCVLDDVIFENCSSSTSYGAAVQAWGGTTTMNNCIFRNNSANDGSHVAVMNDGVLNMTGCSLTEGHATEYGGAILYNSSAMQYGEIKSSLIYGNSADVSGGGIYVNTGRLVVDGTSKLYGNTAPKGEDMTVLVTGNGSYSDSLDTLNELFADDNIKVNGWNWTEDPDTATKYYKLDYEDIVEPSPTPDPSEPGDSGNTEEPSKPGDSGSGDDSGNTGDSGKEEPSTPSPSDPGDSSGDQDGKDDKKDDAGNTEKPGTPSDASSSTNTDNSSHDSTTTTTDNSSHNNTTDNSDHSSQNTTTNNNSDNSRTESSDNHSSTTYNYYQNQQQQTPVQQPQVQSEQAKDPVVINNYIQPSEQVLRGLQGQQMDIPASIDTDPGNNIRIDAKGADVTFEVKDGVYSITINASEPESVQTEEAASNVNWYEVIKIVLLAVLAVDMLWKPRKEHTKC